MIGQYKNIAIPTGRLIREIIENNGFDEMEIIRKLGMPPTDFYDLLEGDIPLTYENAVKLGEIFDIDPICLINFEKLYQEDLAKVEAENRSLVLEPA